MKTLTLIVPCYNEAEALPYFYDEVCRVGKDLTEYELELLFVDDGSKDGTLALVKELAQKDERVKYLSFSRNFGNLALMQKQFSIAAGVFVRKSVRLIVKSNMHIFHGNVVAAYKAKAVVHVHVARA